MSSTDSPFGLRPAFHQRGGTIRPFTAPIASAYGTSIFSGDAVRLVTAGTLERAAATETIAGVFAGCDYTDAAGNRQTSPYWPASTTATDIVGYFIADPDVIYEIQATGSLTSASVGDAADLVVGTGNTKSGQSTSEISTTLAGAGNSAQLKIVGLGKSANNEWGDAYTVVQVIINELQPAFTPGNAV